MTEQVVILDYKPRTQFKAFHSRPQRYACIVAHRRAGKTVACVRDLERAALRCSKPRPRFAYIAPTYTQAKTVAWEYLKQGAHQIPGSKINESELRVDYPNEGQARIYGGDNPDSLRGIYLDGVVLDEYADMKPNLYSEVLRPALADRQGWAVFIGTPKGRDTFYKVWNDAVNRSEEWYSLILRASETGLLPSEELAAARADMSEQQYNREFECSFDEPGTDQFISGIEVNAARTRQSLGQGPKVMGVDVARFGDDRTVIVYRNGDVLEDIDIYRGLDTMQTVGKVILAVSQWNPEAVFVDVNGVGAGVCDRLRQLKYPIFEVNASSSPNETQYKNLRAEMWGKMRLWIRDRAKILPREDLANDLTSLTYKFDHRNALQLESKDDLKKRGLPSPDIADALALTFAQSIAPKEMRNAKYGQQVAYDDDPIYRGPTDRRGGEAIDPDPIWRG